MTDVAYGTSAGRIFLTKTKIKTPGGRIVSVLINTINAGTVATSITYILSLTGKDHAVVKGAGTGAFMWVCLAGFILSIGMNVKSKKPISPLINLPLHILFGAMCGYTIIKLGDNSLFPDKNVENQKKYL